MTYTTKKILANFLDNDEGLLSKKFIETATILFGQSLAKRAFIESLRVSTRADHYLHNPVIVFPHSMSANNLYDTVSNDVASWYPGHVERVQLGNQDKFDIFRVTRYTYDDSPLMLSQVPVDLYDCIRRHMRMSQESHGGPEVGSSSLFDFGTDLTRSMLARLTTELLYETLYDSVSAQGYNKPANSEELLEYIMSLMIGNRLFDWPRWAGSDGIIHRSDLSDLYAVAS